MFRGLTIKVLVGVIILALVWLFWSKKSKTTPAEQAVTQGETPTSAPVEPAPAMEPMVQAMPSPPENFQGPSAGQPSQLPQPLPNTPGSLSPRPVMNLPIDRLLSSKKFNERLMGLQMLRRSSLPREEKASLALKTLKETQGNIPPQNRAFAFNLRANAVDLYISNSLDRQKAINDLKLMAEQSKDQVFMNQIRAATNRFGRMHTK